MTNTSIALRRAWPIVPLSLLLSGCEAIEGIFKAGVWSGVIIVVLALGLVAFVMAKVRQP
jgi:hypothetical protein